MSVRALGHSSGSRRPGSPASPRPDSGPRVEFAVALALSLAGLTVSALLARLHAQAHAGAASFCAFSETVNCDRVALSRLSVQLGLPVAVWGVVGYALMGALAASGVARRRSGSTWPAGLLLLVSAAAAVASVALAAVSKVAIGAWCPLCVVSWLISFGLLAAAWRACRGPGAGGAIRADLAALRARPLRAGAVVLLLLGGVALTAAGYPRYWERTPASVRNLSSEATGPAIANASAGPLVVFEYTDYECPFCARMHEETRALVHRPDVTLVRRHFPLDPACNPAVKRQVHPSACTLARAGICAEAQGRLAEMEDALFANQRERAPVETLAARVGLDLDRFRACLASPETDRRVAADVAAGVRDGVRATPSYVVDGTVHAGRLPPELLRPVRATHGG
jgi:protein-disulfide isomerase